MSTGPNIGFTVAVIAGKRQHAVAKVSRARTFAGARCLCPQIGGEYAGLGKLAPGRGGVRD